MFGEMLEQGVANGDADKAPQYGVIIARERAARSADRERARLREDRARHGRYKPPWARRAARPRRGGHVRGVARPAGSGRRGRRAHPQSDHGCGVSGGNGRRLEIDRDVVVQAVLNLIANAAKYGGADKPIEVSVGADELRARAIAVRDHGPGIPAHEQARIFREFYRAPDAYRSSVEGTGLGLALVKRHIEALGGTVEVESRSGEGATFTMPAGARSVDRDADPRRRGRSVDPHGARGHARRPRATRSRWSGAVARAPSGATSGRYDLVVLDVMLPDIDGFEVCRRIRAARARRAACR